MTNLESIIRLGVGPEFCDVWTAVQALCDCPSPSKRLELIAELETAYQRCEGEYRRVEGLIDSYCEPDGEGPGDLRGGRIVPK